VKFRCFFTGHQNELITKRKPTREELNHRVVCVQLLQCARCGKRSSLWGRPRQITWEKDGYTDSDTETTTIVYTAYDPTDYRW
jgi:hypothetical protein